MSGIRDRRRFGMEPVRRIDIRPVPVSSPRPMVFLTPVYVESRGFLLLCRFLVGIGGVGFVVSAVTLLRLWLGA